MVVDGCLWYGYSQAAGVECLEAMSRALGRENDSSEGGVRELAEMVLKGIWHICEFNLSLSPSLSLSLTHTHTHRLQSTPHGTRAKAAHACCEGTRGCGQGVWPGLCSHHQCLSATTAGAVPQSLNSEGLTSHITHTHTHFSFQPTVLLLCVCCVCVCVCVCVQCCACV